MKRTAVRTKGSPTELDVLIGKQIRFRRGVLKMSQTALARELGLTFQQIQKYETGKNRVSASRLYEISQILNTPINSFFIDFNADSSEGSSSEADIYISEETMKLLKAYYVIDEEKRMAVIKFLENLAD